MHTHYLTLFTLSLFFCTCGPAEPLDAPPRPPESTEWLLTTGAPLDYYNSSGQHEGFRLDLTEDSARIYNPFLRHDQRYRSYAADSTEQFPDSLYLTYAMTPDSTLHVRLRTPDGETHDQTYRPVPRLDAHPLTPALTDRTYQFALDGKDFLLVFDKVTTGKGDRQTLANLYPLDTTTERRITKQFLGFGFPEREDGTVNVSFPSSTGKQGGRHQLNALLLSATADGQLQAHQMPDDREGGRSPRRVFPQPYPAVIPADYDHAELLQLMNRGQVSARKLTPEPDSVGVKYAYPDDFSGLTERELSQLDFEFADDGTYHAFAGDRMISAGEWTLSADRNFIVLPGQGWGGRLPSLIRHYDGEEIAFPLTIRVQTEKPRGKELLSYYEAEVMVQFTAEEL